jgi:hypothetical protein
VYAAAQIEAAIAACVGSAPGGGAGSVAGGSVALAFAFAFALIEVDGAAVGTADPFTATDATGTEPFAGFFRQPADADVMKATTVRGRKVLECMMEANVLRWNARMGEGACHDVQSISLQRPRRAQAFEDVGE